jgi:hypothetical protein
MSKEQKDVIEAAQLIMQLLQEMLDNYERIKSGKGLFGSVGSERKPLMNDQRHFGHRRNLKQSQKKTMA